MLDAATVEIVPSSSSKVKGVSHFSLNDRIDPENPFISYEVCVVKKRSLQVHSITETHFALLIEISLPEAPLQMVYSEPFVCLASTSEYQIVNVKHSQAEVHNLFPYPDTPVILSITDSETHEFVLSGPGGLGMFVSAQSLGAPRLPINWAELLVTKMQYASPYILVYSEADIWVYSSINQQPKQSLPFDKCQCLCRADFEGKEGRLTPMMASATQVWALENIPWQEQVETLLEDRSVEEALQVARTFSSSQDDAASLKAVLQRAAFVQLSKDELTSAKELLLESQAPPEEVLKFCPDLLPNNDPFAEPADDLLNPFTGGRISEGERNAFLLAYLDEYRRIVQITPEVNLVLLKLFALARDQALLPFVKSYRNIFPYEESKALLEEHQCYVALAFFELRIGHPDSALQWLTGLVDGQVTDKVNGQDVDAHTVADILKNMEEGNIVLRHLPWLLEHDWRLALDVLKSGHLKETSSLLLKVLDGHSQAQMAFLEYLLFEKHLKDDELYMKLADAYIDLLTDWSQLDKTEVDRVELGRKLQALLMSDCLKDIETISQRIEHTQLHAEKIILLAKVAPFSW
ncbi:hypothetical protein RvY_11067-2 [Ramazzottius varieornatus]|uniref:CNH domain-containing protein n=1 Tax=Ramazzottius varieornatus TaxID=947166 RepID=A0A1D1VEX8_RAMVA|nr:hypothetical protein RvY_11067-2 [Ramazzottius varieornatus]